MTRAAVLVEQGRPLEIQTVTVAEPQAGELKLRMAASGVCHTDLSLASGRIPQQPGIILGHEGAGVVERVGEGVTDFAPGDHVVISWVPQCGACFYCARDQHHLCEVGRPVASAGSMLDGSFRTSSSDGVELRQMFAAGTFAEELVIPTMAAVKIDPSIDLRAAALVGCGVLTGAGAALRTATIRPGDSVLVLGCGGVGLNVVQGARLAGATRVIAVDREPGKLALAEQFGATHGLLASGDIADEVLDLTDGRGADVAFEVVGRSETAEQAIALTRPGGESVLVGVAPPDAMLTLPLYGGVVRHGRTIKGCFYGSSDVGTDVPFLLDSYREGRVKLDELISREIDLDEVNDALDAMGSGEIARSVIVY